MNDTKECTHKNTKLEGGFLVCQDCGIVLDSGMDFERSSIISEYSDSQRDYERGIWRKDSKATQDPKIKEQYNKILTLEKWFKDSVGSFSEQKKTIDLLKSYGIGLNIDQVKFQEIKDKYLGYSKKYRKPYQNMVIIFLAIIWIEVKDLTNIRIEKFIEVCNELGHKINKKMLNNAMLKIKNVEKKRKKKINSQTDIERDIKEKIIILFQKDINSIAFNDVNEFFIDKPEYEKLKMEMLFIANELLQKIDYQDLKNLNYKAFTAGLIYYVGQIVDKRKIFTQSLIEDKTGFSSTTIRKKYQILKQTLGDPKNRFKN